MQGFSTFQLVEFQAVGKLPTVIDFLCHRIILRSRTARSNPDQIFASEDGGPLGRTEELAELLVTCCNQPSI
jgi:hypothetical protein